MIAATGPAPNEAKEITMNRALPSRRSRTLAALAGALALAAVAATPAQAEFGIDAFDGAVANQDGSAYTQAGGHPYEASTAITFNRHDDPSFGPFFPPGFVEAPDAPIKSTVVDLPPGLIGNPEAIPAHCTAEELSGDPARSITAQPFCPFESQVGVVRLRLNVSNLTPDSWTFPLYSMEAPPDVPARFGFLVAGSPVFLNASVRSGDFGISIGSEGIPVALQVWGFEVTFWGTPGDPRHDEQRCQIGRFGYPPSRKCTGTIGTGSEAEAPHSIESRTAFVTNPTACTPAGEGLVTTARADSWENPGVFDTAQFESHLPPGYRDFADPHQWDPSLWGPPQGPTGCENVPFDPSVSAEPTTTKADSPAGMEVEISVPQQGLENPDGLASAHLKQATVTLPEGMALNPSAADGLGACTEAQIGLGSSIDPSCPDSAKIGTVEIDTPVLEEPLEGAIYQAEQGKNPFDSLLALYVHAEGPGVDIKLPGMVQPDPDTGQLVTTFDDNPQTPFTSFRLRFKGGSRGVLATPPTCGTYEIVSELASWARPGEAVTSTSEFTIDRGPNGGPCLAGDASQPGDAADLAQRPFSVDLAGGSHDAVAGQTSPFSIKLTRPDGHQEFDRTTVETPPGLSAYLRGIPQCSDADAQAGTCPAESKVGSSTTGAGAGPNPFYITAGEVFLAGPYKGAPLSLVIEVPAVAGPFDLGTVLVRAQIQVDPRTAQLTVVSDPLPRILEGIPLRIRDVRVQMNRPEFTVNPTNCEPMEINATTTGSEGAVSSDSQRFQVGDCGSLGFDPELRFKAIGKKKQMLGNGHPGLRASLDYPETGGQANISRVEATLPAGVQLDQDSPAFVAPCTRPQYAAGECPQSSRIGYAKATSPLLDEPLEGPVYLKTSDNLLPDIAADLDGIIDIDLFGRVDQIGNAEEGESRIRNTFDIVPDAPVSDFELSLKGGRDGVLVNINDGRGNDPGLGLCTSKKRRTADLEIDAHNGDSLAERTKIAAKCPNKKKPGKGNGKPGKGDGGGGKDRPGKGGKGKGRR